MGARQRSLMAASSPDLTRFETWRRPRPIRCLFRLGIVYRRPAPAAGGASVTKCTQAPYTSLTLGSTPLRPIEQTRAGHPGKAFKRDLGIDDEPAAVHRHQARAEKRPDVGHVRVVAAQAELRCPP